MKHVVTKAVGFLLALAFVLTGIPFMEAQAVANPVISSSQVAISGNSCTITVDRKAKLTAKAGKTNITKKGTWKSSKKAVATVSKKGMLTAKKTGTTIVTVKYKGKTSKKMKVTVISPSTEPEGPSDPGTEPENPTEPEAPSEPDTPSVTGSHTIKYNVNSKNKSDKLSGSSTQYVSGEILKFDATVQADSSHKFLGWYDAPTGGNRIYETYRPSNNMTLYAHYTDKSVHTVTFVLGCNYGDTYSFMSGASKSVTHYRDFDWLKQEDLSGPMVYSDSDNVAWHHTYTVSDDKKTFSVDSLPVPSIPGYTFVGWYTTEQNRYIGNSKSISLYGDKIEDGSKVSTDNTIFYARFTKKITISFDDFRGGTYDDIVVDSYKSIADCGQELPIPEIPGATFLGWTMDIDNNATNWSKRLITKDDVFLNCIEWYGFMCSECGAVSKHFGSRGYYCMKGCIGGSVNDDYHVFEETDHFTLYPSYSFHRIDVLFDPMGGYFPCDATENRYLSLTFDDGITDWDYSHDSVGLLVAPRGSQPYGDGIFPGHESEPDVNSGGWYYGNGYRYLPSVKRRNYVFDKWVYLDKDGKEQELTFDTILGEDMTVYAKWNPGTCTVYYDATDCRITTEERNRVGLGGSLGYKVTTNSTLAKDGKDMPVPVSTEGRKFEGWYTFDGEEFTKDMQILKDITLYAHWGKLQKELPVTLKFNANGGTFKNASDATKTVAHGDSLGQLPELEDYPDHEFSGWYVVKPDSSSPYDDSSFLQKATNTTRVTSAMANAENEVLIVAKWSNVEHVTDISIHTLDDRGGVTLDKDNNHYSIVHNGKGVNTGLEFAAIEEYTLDII